MTRRRAAESGEAQENSSGTRLRAELTKVYGSSLEKVKYVTLCRSDKQSAMGSKKEVASSSTTGDNGPGAKSNQ